MSEGRLNFELSFEKLGVGVSSESKSCLLRPFSKLFNEGKPIGKINYIFYREQKGLSFNLGTLCYSPAERILFFPGLNERTLIWYSTKEGEKGAPDAVLVDHLTLEKNLISWHITMLDSAKQKTVKIPKYRTKKLSKPTIFWFSLSVKEPKVLEQTPEKITTTLSEKLSEVERRSKLIINARENAVYHIVHLPAGSHLDEDEFLNFDFYLGLGQEKDFSKYAKIVGPLGESAAKDMVGRKKDIPCRAHPVSLEGFTGTLWVMVSKLKGKLTEKAIITSID